MEEGVDKVPVCGREGGETCCAPHPKLMTGGHIGFLREQDRGQRSTRKDMVEQSDTG